MFPEEVLEKIVEERNRYARQCMEKKPNKSWYPTAVDEMRAFFALNIYFGVKALPETRMYWSSDPFIGVQEVTKVMCRNRFEKIRQYLHVNDGETALPRENCDHDKLHKISGPTNYCPKLPGDCPGAWDCSWFMIHEPNYEINESKIKDLIKITKYVYRIQFFTVINDLINKPVCRMRVILPLSWGFNVIN